MRLIGSERFYYSTIDPLFKSNISDIVYDESENLLFVATRGTGILIVKGSDFLHIDTQKGLPSNICNRLFYKDGELLIATNHGAASLRQLDFASGTFSLATMDRYDGLSTDAITAIAKRDSQIYLATLEGIFQVNERDLKKQQNPPVIDIISVIINESEAAIQPTYQLQGDQKNIRIQFVGLSQRSAGNLVYKYRLEDVDQDWIFTKSRETHYSDLAPGSYRFQVFAIDKNGVVSEGPAVLEFNIAPLFYESGWFKLLMILLACALLLAGNYLWHIVQQRRMLRELVSQKTAALNQKVEDLAAANHKLEQSNTELQEFAHVASHDLKTPLRNISGFIQLLKRRLKDRLNPEEAEYMDFAVNGVKQMNHIIEDLLNMSKVKQNDMQKEPIHFGAVIEEVIADMQLELDQNKAEIVIETPMPTLDFSHTNAKRLFQNLISNAVKYKKEKPPKITINCKPENGHYQFSIQDNGIGIPAGFENKAFKMFERLHRDSSATGTGIGLAICKKIIEHNQGKIWYESVEHKGTTFYFTLPR
jgi:signal transduction histidine kinase